MKFRSVRDIAVGQRRRVIVRADFDVAVRNRRIMDATRIVSALPTVRLLLRKRMKIRLLAHLGRPAGARREDATLLPVARFLARALRRPVPLVSDPFLGAWDKDADIVLFENLRFWMGEESNDPAFAASLAAYGDVYVNEAFANSHRPHASMVSLPVRMPAYAGLCLVREVEALKRVCTSPARPLVAVLGGAKIETKIPLIRRFLRHADQVLVGGALANALFAARGDAVGRSIADIEKFSPGDFLKRRNLILPTDAVVADRLAAGANAAVRVVGAVQPDEYIADIGPATVEAFAPYLTDAATIVWNGPMGYVEAPRFARGTISVARAIRRGSAFSVVGGGDTVAALRRRRLLGGFSHVSTGGGAMLMFLAGEKLPGLQALQKHAAQI